ncbi:GAF domain-containing sensor histidine kinase [Reyranella sp.]|uniref:GAF domain-containing sensor histidine kinase n=1 Tax=Reyranella sp. TaxID=1929291 RepID=UPI00403594E8
MEARRHSDEGRRVAALRAYDILDTPREEEFDEVVRVVSAICGTPISVINLIDSERQWFKAEIGLGVRETPLPASICSHAILQPDLFIVPDTLADQRFSDNPLVTGDPRLRFYAGALLKTPEGLPLGTICVLDYKPRDLDENQKALLRLTARQIMKMMELRRLNAAERIARERAETHAEATTARLAHANRESDLREQFIAVLGHDLRNPLASIQAGAQLVKRGKLTLDEMLQLTQGSISRMSALIDNILDFARGRLGTGIDLARTEVLLTPTLTQVVDELRAAAPDRRIAANIAMSESVFCDPGRIGQLLSNLLGNAVVHGAPGTPIDVEAKVKDGTFELSVRNAGDPIPDAALAKLFQPFFRGEARPSQQGLGLGLYICSEIARAHGGTLTASSTPEATTLLFRMPVKAEF